MSNSTTSIRKRENSRAQDESGADTVAVPRALVHKQILETAESRPDASMEAIADEVTGASLSIVERVLDEYGDPAEPDTDGDDEVGDAAGESDESGTVDSEPNDAEPPEPEADAAPETETEGSTDAESGSDETESSTTDSDSGNPPSLEPSDLTEKQLETLREIRERPNATQAELGEALGVTSATINQRVNAIEPFDWSRRREFVEALFSEESPSESDEAADVDADPDRNPDADSDGKARSNGLSGGAETADELDAFESGAPLAETRPAWSDQDQPRSDGGDPTETPADEGEECAADGACVTAESLEDLTDQLAALIAALEDLPDRISAGSVSHAELTGDPELTHKLVHACVTADHISEEEELRILKAVLSGNVAPE